MEKSYNRDEIAINEFGATVKKYRKKFKLSQQALADLTGLPKKTIWNIEKGKTNTSLTAICRLIWAMELEPNNLIPYVKKDEESSPGKEY